MERGPLALFGAIIAVGLGPAMWLGAQFGHTTTLQPSKPPAATVQQNSGVGGAAPNDPAEVLRSNPKSNVEPLVTATPKPRKPSASPSASASPSPSESSTPGSPPPSEEQSTPPSERPTDPGDDPPSDGGGGGSEGGAPPSPPPSSATESDSIVSSAV